MGKTISDNVLFNRVARWLIIVLPLLTILYWKLIELRFIYYWDVFWPPYRRLLYLLSVFILLGFLVIYLFLQSHSIVKFLVLIFTIPLFCFGSVLLASASPTILDTKQFNNYTYYLFAEDEPLKPHTFIRLVICKTDTFECWQTSFEERADVANNLYYLVVAPKKNEVHVLGESQPLGYIRLQYTYGDYPRHYGFPENLEDQLFYLAYYYHEDPQTPRVYTLYQCNLDHTLCNLLPFEYTYKGSQYSMKIQANPSTKEINVYHQSWDSNDLEYKNETLIYTYGEQPHCFVKGCEILEN